MSKLNYNVVLVPTNQESITNILEDYANMCLSCETVGGYREMLQMFYNEIVLRVEQDQIVESTLLQIERLKEIDEELDQYRS